MKRYYEIRDRSDAHFYSIFDSRCSSEPVARVHVDLLDKVLAALNAPKGAALDPYGLR